MATAAATGWYAGKAVVATGKAIGDSGILNSPAAQMTKADEVAKTKTLPQDIAQVCSTCPPPPECKQLKEDIMERRDELAKRYQEMREDKLGLFEAEPGGIPGMPGAGNWQGHLRQFNEKQTSMRKMLDKSRSMNCGNTGDAAKWGSKPTPTQPAPK